MTKFRPCIDLHDGRVKQIVGGSLRDQGGGPIEKPAEMLVENYVADQPAGWFAAKYRDDGLTGGHIIKLGPGNDQAATEALAAYPDGMQIGGGITVDNAKQWIEAGASHVIVTSWLFDAVGNLLENRLKELVQCIGRDRIVLDLSCRRVSGAESMTWRVAMNRWQTITEIEITPESLDRLAVYGAEFLIHAADVEGLCQGIDYELVQQLGRWATASDVAIPMTYAGGVATMGDVQQISKSSGGAIDVTVGSALDLFGGNGVRYADLVKLNR
ncbi:phosphoribosylformimino-5-aminoimidazole carboxamide ribotide isomerase [Rubripirellula reticaptiva]|uniref:1-(5-phosphoribosyl)-5-[(5-phosphoribosylamino)methylideneamino] imidazole-4-carboxamide isomerase n=1 Tax=Rubripirellula reticaptiva TaxID=2528013 RepID=A0A5C6EIX9_9BACT|nr:phosphoribosylformimino-5-aminoimidazole carboxamide ribotide isomerase [Rubripirellula reticaptiva]TWU48454.1 1-(5-phosphoribosyl)-5-[(5-phosphoribosylamino)methylideneamino] imidazole-4-carboxamide isomerase [Rubripirellula reticaptiva]